MHVRTCGVRWIAATALAACGPAAWSLELTERQAVERALARPAYAEWEAGRLGAAQGAVTETARLPNPVVKYEQERLSVPGGHSTESRLGIEQTFDFSGRRALRVEAAEQRVAAERHEIGAQRLQTIAEVRRSFAEALSLERQRRAFAAWVKRIEAASGTIARLARAGEVAGYESRRTEREVQAARARLAAAGGDALRAKEQLRGLVGLQFGETLELAGELLPPEPPPLERALGAQRARPDLAALLAQAEAFDRERTAAEREWAPDVTLGVGQKRVEEPSFSDNGLMLWVALPLPVFDRGEGRRDSAAQRARALRAEHTLRIARREAEIRGIWRQAAELRAGAVALRAAPMSDLSRTAETAYRAGEGGILELLDAYRAELGTELAALDLELRARLARIELDALSGVDHAK